METRPTSGDQDDAADADLGSIVSRHERKFQTVGDMVHSVIRESILRGVLAPGEYLRQDKLANAIGVSRIPVRSALLQLESEGLVTFHPYRGAVVNRLSFEDMHEIYELRGVLEGYAMRRVAETMTPERLDELDEIARELHEMRGGEEFLQRRFEFYRALYDEDRNPHLVALIEKLLVESGRFWLDHRLDPVLQPQAGAHQQVLERLRAGDVEGAVKVMEGHLQDLRTQLAARMEAAGSPVPD